MRTSGTSFPLARAGFAVIEALSRTADIPPIFTTPLAASSFEYGPMKLLGLTITA